MRAVVFDFDGVIARSMELHAEAYRKTLEPLGVPVTDAEVFQLEGSRSQSVINHFLRNHGKEADPETVERLSKEKQQYFRGLPQPELYAGAEDMVRAARSRAQKLGIVTGTRRENLDRIIPSLLPLFDAVLAQDSYTKDKPDPEPYQRAAEALQMDPRSCLAVENAPFGIRSARAAGYGYVLALVTTVGGEQLSASGADEVVRDHEAAARAILRVLAG